MSDIGELTNAKRGITLIALIITVIILLILAGTAISISINGGDLFGKSQNAVSQYNAKVAEEENKINEVWDLLKEKKAIFADGLSGRTHSFGNFQQITSIERATQEPAEQYKKATNIVSAENSDYPIYMWNENNILYWYCEAKHPKLSPNSEGLFAVFRNLQNVSGIHDWDTSDVTTMNSMFAECFSLENIDLSSWNTSSVTNLESMFHTCGNLVNLNLSSWNTSNVTNAGGIFAACYALTSLDLSSWNTSNITDMGRMFDMSENPNLSGSGISNLQTIIVSPNFKIDHVTNSTDMFKNCTSLIGGNGTIFDSTKTDVSMAHIDGGAANPGYFTLAQ